MAGEREVVADGAVLPGWPAHPARRRCGAVAALAVLWLGAGAGSSGFAVRRQQGAPEFRTLQTKATWRLKEGEEDKRSLMATLRSPNTKPRELAATAAALQQRRLLTDPREYTTTINVLGRLGLWRECLGLLVDMQRNGLKPNVITYNAVLKALARSKRWREAIQLIGEMWDSRLSPDVISYTTAISACAASGRWKEALQLLAEMERAGIKASRVGHHDSSQYGIFPEILVPTGMLVLTKAIQMVVRGLC